MPRLAAWGLPAVLALVYAGAAVLSLRLAFANSSASPVWPPAGIAIAGLLLLGRRAWPAVALGAFAANLFNTGNAAASAGIAVGNTAEALLAAWGIATFAGGPAGLRSSRNVLPAALAMAVAALAGATWGTATLLLNGLAPWQPETVRVLVTWWMGDVSGAVLVGSFLLLSAARDTRVGVNPWEVVAAGVLLAASGLVVFGDLLLDDPRPIAFLTFPALVWSAARFGPRLTVSGTFILAAAAIAATLAGHGPFHDANPNRALLLVDGYILIVTVLVLLMATVVEERRRAIADSEGRFMAFMDHAPAMAWIKDAQGRYVFANRSFAATLGRTPAEVIGRNDLELVGPAVAAEWVSNDEKVRRSGASMQATERNLAGGEPRTSLVSKFTIPLQGSPSLVGGMAVDITERQRAEQEARAAQARVADARATLEEAQAIAHVGSWEWDLATQSVSWSAEMYRIYGVPADVAVTTKTIPERIHPDDREALSAAVRAAVANGTTFTNDHRVMLPDGRLRHVHTSGHAVKAPDGAVKAIVGTTQDVSEQRRLERRFRGLLESAPDAMVIVGPDGKIVLVNSQAERVFGHARGAMLGQPVEMLIPDRFGQRHAQYRGSFSQNAKPRAMGAGLALFGKRADGSEFPVEVSLAPLETEEGMLVSSVIRDITERKRNEAVVGHMAAIVATSDDAILSIGLDGRILSWNRGAERLFGYTADEAVGRPVALLHPPGDLGDEAQMLERTRLGEQWVNHETVRQRKDGSQVAVAITLSPVRDGTGRVVGASKIVRDITAAKRNEAALVAAKQAAEAAARTKSEFLANMSHEIRTPMNAVIGMTELLLGTTLDEEQSDMAGTIRSSGEHLLSVINDILDFSKVESGKLELEAVPTPVARLVEDCVALVRPRATEKGLHVEVMLAPGVPEAVRGDARRIRQILLNLLANAVKFTHKGRIDVEVMPARLAAGEGLEFRVRDTGIGIPAEARSRLFKSFSQVDASATRAYGGTGLGLAISKALAEAMGGSIRFESELGKGSTFIVQLAVPPCPLPSPALVARERLAGRRVLVVDDIATNRTIFRRQLEHWGLEVVEAASGQEALKLLADGQRFDLALLDHQMPGMDGAELANRLRAAAATQALPIVMASSIDERSFEPPPGSGLFRFLTKPVQESRLQEAVLAAFQPASLPAHPQHAAGLAVLLAEDNLVNQKVAIRMLERLGYRPDVAQNGEEAVRAVTSKHYDIVLMDVQMPVMDGVEATKRIQSLAGTDKPAIIAMTAHAMPGDREKYLQAGMDDYIAKPVRLDTLAAVLEAHKNHHAAA